MKFPIALPILCLLGPPLLLAQATRTLSLTGQVVDGLSNKPLTDVDLFLFTADWDSVAGPVPPDEHGNFSFTGLAPGSYILRADRPDFDAFHYGQLPDWKVQPITLAAGAKPAPLLFRIPLRGSFSGTVFDESGEPLTGVTVAAYRATWDGTSVNYTSSENTQSDDLGRYRITNLSGGSYVVCAFIPGSSRTVPSIGPVDFSSAMPRLFYGRACRPDDSGRLLSSLQLSPGQKMSLDLTLPSVPHTALRGKVVGDVAQHVAVRLRREPSVNGLDLPWNASTDDQHTFALQDIPSGDYLLELESQQRNPDGSGPPAFARIPVSLSGGTRELEVAMKAAVTLAIVFHSPQGATLAPNVVSVGLIPATGDPTVIQLLKPDGSRNYDALAEGAYWLQTRTSNSTCIAAATLDGKDVLHRRLSLSSGANMRLDLTLSQHCAGIEGKIISPLDSFPVTRLVVLLSGTPEEPGDPWADIFTEAEFSVSLLPAGSYWIWAWAEDASSPFTGPESLKAAAKYATRVDVKDGESKKVSIPLLGLSGEFK